MEITDAQKQLDSNPAAGLLARRDLADIATNLKAQRPDLRASIDADLAALDKALPGKSAAAQYVAIDATRAALGNELRRATLEREAAQVFAAQRDAAFKAADRERHDLAIYRARATGAAQGVLQGAVAKLNGFSTATLSYVENATDLANALTAFDDLLDSIKGSFAAAIAPHIAADTTA